MEAREEEKLARTESAFRKVNEGIDAGRGLTDAEAEIDFVCECGRLGCTQMLRVKVAEYEVVRSSGRRFIVAPGHVAEFGETVVETGDGYVVTEKTGAAGERAEQLDPRD